MKPFFLTIYLTLNLMSLDYIAEGFIFNLPIKRFWSDQVDWIRGVPNF